VCQLRSRCHRSSVGHLTEPQAERRHQAYYY
jgi:hypothetical protein